jgi:hypothetical protein
MDDGREYTRDSASDIVEASSLKEVLTESIWLGMLR